MSIPKGFGSIEDLLRRFKKAREEWELFRSLHQEAFDFSAPQRQTFTQRSPGQRKNRHIFDSTAVFGLEQFASKIHGAVLPPWQEFFNFVAGGDIPEDEQDKTNKGLEDVTSKFFQHLNHSNFSTELPPALTDLGIGTGAIMIEEGDFKQGQAFKFSNVPLSECYPERPSSGAIQSVWRWQEVVARDIKTTWPKATLPSDLANKIEKQPNTKCKILNGFLFNPEDSQYHQVVIHEPSKTLMFTQAFKTKRLIVFRWHVVPGETFGRGPIMQVLPDIRTANKVMQFMLENAAIQMSGVYTGVDDGIFNPHTARIAPGTVIPVKSNATQNASIVAMTPSGNIGVGEVILEKLQNNIKKALFSEPFGEIQDPVRTATEQMLRKQEMLETRGASLGRMKSELIEPLAAAGVEILAGLGEVLPNLTVDGKTVTLKQTSPLAKAEDLEDFQNFQVWFAFNSQLPPELVAGTVKVENIPRWTQQKLGVPAELVRSEDEAAAFGEKVVETAQASPLGQGGAPIEEGT
jgi:hypothetical protein